MNVKLIKQFFKIFWNKTGSAGYLLKNISVEEKFEKSVLKSFQKNEILTITS